MNLPPPPPAPTAAVAKKQPYRLPPWVPIVFLPALIWSLVALSPKSEASKCADKAREAAQNHWLYGKYPNKVSAGTWVSSVAKVRIEDPGLGLRWKYLYFCDTGKFIPDSE